MTDPVVRDQMQSHKGERKILLHFISNMCKDRKFINQSEELIYESVACRYSSGGLRSIAVPQEREKSDCCLNRGGIYLSANLLEVGLSSILVLIC